MATANRIVKDLFSAPVLQCVWKDHESLNENLMNLILAKREETPGVKMSNTGGWQSEKELQTWESPAVPQLIEKINTAVLLLLTERLGEDNASKVGTWHIAAWANINERGDYNTLHNHSGAFFSGVYYVNAGITDEEHPFSGVITFRNPTLAALAVDNLRVSKQLGSIFRSEYSILPQDGLMLLFPGWLQHEVHPYFGNTPRVSISWDVVF
jgi:uncharacterized protein (TIGR02466 family)